MVQTIHNVQKPCVTLGISANTVASGSLVSSVAGREGGSAETIGNRQLGPNCASSPCFIPEKAIMKPSTSKEGILRKPSQFLGQFSVKRFITRHNPELPPPAQSEVGQVALLCCSSPQSDSGTHASHRQLQLLYLLTCTCTQCSCGCMPALLESENGWVCHVVRQRPGMAESSHFPGSRHPSICSSALQIQKMECVSVFINP